MRPQFISPVAVQNDPQEVAPPRKTTSEEIKKLRFQKNITAFDVDIDALDSHPWRNKNADISYYFNYGFTEKTWLVSTFKFYYFTIGNQFSFTTYVYYRTIAKSN